MQTQGEEFLAQPAVQSPSAPTQPSPVHKAVAPWWHTVIFIIILLGNSYVTAITLPKAASGASGKARAFEYLFTIVWEFVLLLIVWVGIRLRRVTIRELIGGRWNRVEDFLIDVAIAGAGVFGAYLVVGVAAYLAGLGGREHLAEGKKLAEMLAPSSLKLLALFFVLSTVAGFVEEILFRGYLQKQFAALTGSVVWGLMLQAVFF